jgi:hypothetical protein
MLVVGIAALLPFALSSVMDNVLQPAEGVNHPLSVPIEGEGAASQSRLLVSVVGIDEVRGRATLWVSGHRVCAGTCAWGTQVVFFSFGTHEATIAGMPPSAIVALPPTDSMVTQSIELPVQGYPSRYPFDSYTLRLGLGVLRALPDGTVQPMTPAEATDHLYLTIKAQLPNAGMAWPQPVDPASVSGDGDLSQYASVDVLTFTRPLHVRVLAVLLVLLVAAAAVYAVCMRPLQDLVINAGGLVLGVWGVRSILTPGGITYLTAVDLALSVVILFLLGAMTMRALQYCYQQTNLDVFPLAYLRRWRTDQNGRVETSADYDPSTARRRRTAPTPGRPDHGSGGIRRWHRRRGRVP